MLHLVLPWIGVAVLAAGAAFAQHPVMLLLCVPVLLAAVMTSVHHAEVIAHRLGEPFGTLVLTLAVTVIEVALVLSIMIAGDADNATVPRDTVYAAVMIICNGVVGLCILMGGLRHREQSFRIEGTGSGLAALAALSTLVLVTPTLTRSSPGPTYTHSQLVFVALASLALWAIFVFIQTVRHRDYFLPAAAAASDESVHAQPPAARQAWFSFGLLMVALVAVIGLAKLLSPALDNVVNRWELPQAIVGILIAMVVLLPETVAALRAARANRLQTSMNLAIGSALSSIGLTIPLVVLAVVAMDLPLALGVENKDIALIALTFVVSSITLASGRTNLMQGAVHLVIFAAFLFLTLVP